MVAPRCISKLAIMAGCLLLASQPVLGAPGDHFNVLPADIAPPNSTLPNDIEASFVERPNGAVPAVPDGFAVSLFASNLKHPRSIAVAPDGDVFVVEEGPGSVVRLRDLKGGGRADQIQLFASGFRTPHGIALRDGQLYIGDLNAVWRASYLNRDSVPTAEFKRVTTAADLRPDGWHTTRDIVFDPSGKLYLAIGARDDVSEAPLPDATIEAIAENGSMAPFATGLRNVEGLAFYPGTNDLWVTVNERDALGARVPADFFAHVRAGDFFGWPYAYNGAHPDPIFGAKRPDLVIKSKAPDVLIEAHSAPLGLLFYTGKQFPSEYQGDAFIALHGSGPYDKPDAYKVIRIRFKNGKPIGGYEDFVTGFSRNERGNLKVWGTPSQMAVASDGSILLVDDKGACVWRIAYVGK